MPMEVETTVLNDGQLLAEFTRTRREALFESLLNRHGALVYNVCLRVLNHGPDAEDAAQAVFVALAQKANDRSLQARESLAGWLHTAAWHIGVRARTALKARARHEQEAAAMQKNSDDSAAQWREIAPVLDGELHALPEKYRLPIVLHHFEALSVEQIAAATQSSADAVKQRLCRGRDLLRQRLQRRGVNVAVATLPLLLQDNGTTAALPFTFAATTAHAAAAVAAGQALTSGLIAHRVLELSRAAQPEIPRAVKMRLAAAALVLVLFGGGVAAAQAFASKSQPDVTRVRVHVPANTTTATTPSIGTPSESPHGNAPERREGSQTAPLPRRAQASAAATSGPSPRDVVSAEPLKREPSPQTPADDDKIDLTKFVTATARAEESKPSDDPQRMSAIPESTEKMRTMTPPPPAELESAPSGPARTETQSGPPAEADPASRR